MYFSIDACPEAIVDYYGSTEYIGKDPYGHFNNPALTEKDISNLTVSQEISKISDYYGTEPPYERYWYSGKTPSSYIGNHVYSHNSYSLYDKFRMKLH